MTQNTQVRPEEGWPGDPPGTPGEHTGLESLRLHVSATLEMKSRLHAWPQTGQVASGLGNSTSQAGL